MNKQQPLSFLLSALLILLALWGCKQQSTQENTASEPVIETTPYLGQVAPGDTAEVFAAGIISIEGVTEYPCSFSPDFTHMIYGHSNKEKGRYLLESKLQEDDTWSTPQKISFTGFQEGEAIYSPDGSKIFFSVHSDTTKKKIHDLWFVEAEDGGWSEPIKLNDSINSDDYEYFATLTNENRMYFSREGKMMQADFDGTDYVNIQLVDSVINNMEFVSHPYVSLDGSYMIFDSPEPGGMGNGDLYISFNEEDKWRKPVNLGAAINSKGWDGMPMVSPDGKYIFFVRADGAPGDIHWAKFDKERYR